MGERETAVSQQKNGRFGGLMDVQDIVSIISLVIAVLAMAWGIFQTFVSHRLNQELDRLTTQLDERVKRLHRARELVTQRQTAHLFLKFYNSAVGEKDGDAEIRAAERGKYYAAWAELKGLARAISDEELLNLVKDDRDEMEIRAQAQKLHTRIAELLELETMSKRR